MSATFKQHLRRSEGSTVSSTGNRMPRGMQTEPLRTALEDAHPYVRRTAVMGVLKVHYVDAEMVERLSLLEPLRVSALHDPDPQVGPPVCTRACRVSGVARWWREFTAGQKENQPLNVGVKRRKVEGGVGRGTTSIGRWQRLPKIT